MGNFLKLHMQIQLVYAKSETARAIYVRNNNSEYNEPVNFKHQNNPSSLQKKSLASIPTQLPQYNNNLQESQYSLLPSTL